MIKFHNATDSNGHIIHINEVTRGNCAEHYYCVGCAEEMCAVLGDKREHHFRHKKAHCSWESYLHKLVKMRLKERFESHKPFIIKYYVEYHCDQSRGCKLEPILYENQKCNRRKLEEFDLKKQFDTCEEEVTYKGYRADLMLSSKEHPEREPVFIEISVTHDCEKEKLKSGIQIIELKIADEKDVLRPLVEEYSLFELSNPRQPYDFNALPPVRFFNFKRSIETIPRPLERFWVAPDEKGILRGKCIQDNLTCRDVDDNHRTDSLYEVAIPSEHRVNRCKPNLYDFGMVKAIEAGIDVRHCRICDKHSSCNLYNNAFDKVAQASGCNNYVCNRNYVDIYLDYLRNLPYWEWKKE